jgi:hypothetical protein
MVQLSLQQAVEAHNILRLQYFPENRSTDGGALVSLTYRPPFTPRNIPSNDLYWRLCRPQGPSAAGRIVLIEKRNELIRNRSRDLSACSIVSQRYRVPLTKINSLNICLK